MPITTTVKQDTELDIRCFNRLFGEYQQRFIRFAATYVSDMAVAEDFVMEGFMKGWEHREGLSESEFPPYVLTIIKNKCLNHLRATVIRDKAAHDIHNGYERTLQIRISTLQACDPEELFSDETKQMVDKALAKLPTKTREIFVMSRFDGKSYKEIAEIMEITTKSVEFEVSKAMKILRVALKDYTHILLFISLLNIN